MIPCISVENMRLSDAYTIENLVPGLELMYRAAFGVFKAHNWQGRTAIVVGSGNNGGDGFALACIMREQGYECEVFTVSRRLSGDSAHYVGMAEKAGIPIRPFSAGCLPGFDTVVDCLLGTGFQGSVREDYRTAIEAVNASKAFVVSVDINSGMNGDSGEAEIGVTSDLTVTIGYVKKGLVSDNAGRFMKRLVCADIGIRLIREEEWILAPGDSPCSGGRVCPAWLETEPILSV